MKHHRTLQKGLSILLSLVMCLTLLSATALADDSVKINETNFPDATFRSIVSGYDTDEDGTLSTAEIADVTRINCPKSSIASLKGIEFFTALTELNCSENQLTALDVSSNTALTELFCEVNQLTALDVSSNTALKTLSCGGNQLTALNVDNNKALTSLDCGKNNLTALDVGQNTALKSLACHYNDLTTLNVSSNTALKELYCSGNKLTSLDLSTNSLLNYLECTNNVYDIALDENRTFNLSSLPEGFAVGKVSDWQGGEVEGNTLTFDPNVTMFTYTYACGNEKTVTFTLDATPKYTVTFDANGGSDNMDDVKVVSGNYTLPECGFDAPQGLQFVGWATSKSGEVISDTTIPVIQDTTLYAIWGINYGVTVNGVKVTSLNKDNVIVGKKVQYDPATKTLSVKNFVAEDLTVAGDGETIVNISDNLGVPAVGTLTVTDAKDVVVTANSGAPAIYGEANISCTGNVTITNSEGMAVSNKLTVTNAQNVTVEGSVGQAIAGETMITCSGNVTITGGFGMAVSNHLTVKSAKNVTVTANSSTAPAIAGTADITCSGDVKIANSTGIAVNSGLTVKNAKDVTVTANTASPAIAGAADITCSGKVDITNSTGMAVSGALTVKSAKDVTVTANTENTENTDYPAIGGKADITCSGDVKITNKAGMAVSGALTVKNAKDVTVTANTASPAIAGAADITCSGDVTISNTGGGKAVQGTLTYKNAGNVHSCTVEAGLDLDNLSYITDVAVGETFTDTLAYSAVKITVPHTADEWKSSSTQHWQVCTVCEEEFNRADHTFSGSTCTVCGYTKPSSGSSGGGAATYAITVDSAKNGTVTVSPKTAAKGDTVTLTVTPDKGYTLETLTVTDASGKEVKLTEKNGKYTFTMPAGKVTVKATFAETEPENPFVDVSADAYYYDAVLWAAENGITGGVDDTHFAPNAPCTRAQIVTFLWRAAGCPEPESLSSFADVPADAYYAKAVAWAVENGITTGTGDGTTFSPNATCTRAQAMTFLWRSQKSVAPDGVNSFTDVAADTYYADAVLWAAENGITGGTGDGTTFSPNANCTRAQIVTFLFRCLG